MGDTLRWLADPAPAKRAELNRQLDDVALLGVNWVRLDMPWNIVQPVNKSQYWWNSMDVVVNEVRRRHLQVLGILAYTPAWARVQGCDDPKCRPANIKDFADFAAAAAARYAPQGVHTWELWNEPNLQSFWKPAPDPAVYAKLVERATQAIKAVDPQAIVIVGSLAPARTDGHDIAPTDYLEALYKDVGQGFDAVSYHAYSYPFLPTDPSSYNPWHQLDGADPSLYSIMKAHGDGDKKIWITEYGAPASSQVTDALRQKLGSEGLVTADMQAKMMTGAIREVETSPHIGPFFWYSYKDLGTTSDTIENFFGLTDTKGQPKPAYAVFHDTLATLTPRE